MKNSMRRVINVRYILVFQLIFDNYTETGCSDASPATSQSAKISELATSDISTVPDSMEREMEELRQQLQVLKKQPLTALDKAKRSSENEQAALLQAHKSAKLEQAATLEVARAMGREDYIVELLTSAGRDMACTHFYSESLFMVTFSLLWLTLTLFLFE
jgi:hypothetical protein